MYMILYFTTPFKMIITFYTVNQILKYIIYTVYKNVYIYISIHRFFLKIYFIFFYVHINHNYNYNLHQKMSIHIHIL